MEVKDSSVKMTVIKKRNILVETTGRRAEKDRYSLQFDEWTNIMTVGIKKVQLSDSGQYKCKLERTGPDGHETFQISVLKVRPTQRPGPSPDPGFDPDPDPSPSLNPNSTIRPEHELQSEAPHRSSQTGSVLYIGVTLAVILMIFSVVLLIFYCKKKENKPTEFAVNRELGEVPEKTKTCSWRLGINRQFEDNKQEFSGCGCYIHVVLESKTISSNPKYSDYVTHFK
ncbi:uncharacterized protein LOC129411973 isoform X3 [Boleophthalmus pectinirostris]|uniref:uncharacterized protein LOC129411973 isoform X3 n=1 Tax=Boleophthalmus pectinirostris TaxID=150288 RepID=UPI002432CD67|nr:uncharacterized protein LOC129411973 isoform X3 [Boleophthalmus pectinirostris]